MDGASGGFGSGGYGTGRSASPSGLGGGSRSQGGSQVLGMTGGTSMRAQLDSLSMTVHEVVGRIELSGRQILMLCVQARCARILLARPPC